MSGISDFLNYSMRELLWVVQGVNKLREEDDKIRWTHTSNLLWLTAEINRNKDKRKRPFSPKDFNPYEIEIEKDDYVEVDAKALKGLYGNDKSVLKKQIAKAWDKKDTEFFVKIKKKKDIQKREQKEN